MGIGVELGLVHDFVDVSLSIGLSLVLQRFYQTGFSLVGAESGKFLQFSTLLQLHLLEFFLLDRQQVLLIVDALLLVVELVFAASQFLLTLIERQFALFQLVLVLLVFMVVALYLLLQLTFLVKEFLLDFKQFFLLDDFGFLLGSLHLLVIFSVQYVTENDKACCITYYQGCSNGNNRNSDVHKCLYIVLKCSCHLCSPSTSSISRVRRARTSS